MADDGVRGEAGESQHWEGALSPETSSDAMEPPPDDGHAGEGLPEGPPPAGVTVRTRGLSIGGAPYPATTTGSSIGAVPTSIGGPTSLPAFRPSSTRSPESHADLLDDLCVQVAGLQDRNTDLHNNVAELVQSHDALTDLLSQVLARMPVSNTSESETTPALPQRVPVAELVRVAREEPPAPRREPVAASVWTAADSYPFTAPRAADERRASAPSRRRVSMGRASVEFPNELKLPKPKEFAGHKTTARLWFQYMRRYLLFHGVDLDSESAVLYTAAMFSEAAQDWFEACIVQTGDDCGGFATFENLRTAAMLQFQDPEPDRKARMALKNIRQTGSVQDYVRYFRSQILHLPRRDEADNVFDFVAGLRDDVQQQVLIQNPQTLAKATEIALSVAQRLVPVRRAEGKGKERLAYAEDCTDEDEQLSSDDEDCAVAASPSKKAGKFKGSNPKAKGKRYTPEQWQLLKENKCFLCKQEGHQAKDCPGRGAGPAR